MAEKETVEKCQTAADTFRTTFTTLFKKGSSADTICANVKSGDIIQAKADMDEFCKDVSAILAVQLKEKQACDKEFRACREAERATAGKIDDCAALKGNS